MTKMISSKSGWELSLILDFIIWEQMKDARNWDEIIKMDV